MTTRAEQNAARSRAATLPTSLGPPTSLMRNVRDAAASMFIGGTLAGPALAETSVFNQINEELQRKTGGRIFPFGPPDRREDFFDKLRERTERFPDIEFDFPANNVEELDEIIRGRIEVAELDLTVTAERRPGFLGGTARFVGAAGGIVVDPPTTLSILAGGTAGLGIVRTFLREAAIVAAAEVPTQIGVQVKRSSLGLDGSLARGLQNLTIATLGGGLLATAAIKGLQGIKTMLARKRAGKITLPREVEDAAEAVLAKAELDEVLPFVEKSAARGAAVRLLDQAVRALRRGIGLDIQRPSFAITREAVAKVRRQDIPDTDLKAVTAGVAAHKAGEVVRDKVLRALQPEIKAARQAEAAKAALNEPRLDDALELLNARRELELTRRKLLERSAAAKTPKDKKAVRAAGTRLKNDFTKANPQLVEAATGRLTPKGEEVFRSFLAGQDQITLALRGLETLGFNLNNRLTPAAIRGELSRTLADAQRAATATRGGRAAERFTVQPDELSKKEAEALIDAENASQQAFVEARIAKSGDFKVILDEAETSASKLVDETQLDEQANTAITKCITARTP